MVCHAHYRCWEIWPRLSSSHWSLAVQKPSHWSMMTSPEGLRKMTANMAQKILVIPCEYQPWLLVSGLSKNSLEWLGCSHQGGTDTKQFLSPTLRDSRDTQTTETTLTSIQFMLLIQLCQLGKNIIHVSNPTIKPEICRAVLVVIFGLKLAVTLTVPYPGPLVFCGQSETAEALSGQ